MSSIQFAVHFFIWFLRKADKISLQWKNIIIIFAIAACPYLTFPSGFIRFRKLGHRFFPEPLRILFYKNKRETRKNSKMPLRHSRRYLKNLFSPIGHTLRVSYSGKMRPYGKPKFFKKNHKDFLKISNMCLVISSVLSVVKISVRSGLPPSRSRNS